MIDGAQMSHDEVECDRTEPPWVGNTYMIVNNIIMAAAIVVKAAAKIDGPIWMRACLVRSDRECFPL